MRAIKTITVSILSLGLLVGSAVGVAAQDEEAPVGASSFTGTVTDAGDISKGTQTVADGLVETAGVVALSSWESSDPRLTGDAVYTGNWLYETSEGVSIQSATYELTNDGGSWLGEATAFAAPGIDTDTVVLTGRDGYEGLTAYVLIDWTGRPTTLSGVVFPAAMPEVPEPYAGE